MKASYVHTKILDTVHIWYSSGLVIPTYMEEYKDTHAQRRIDM